MYFCAILHQDIACTCSGILFVTSPSAGCTHWPLTFLLSLTFLPMCRHHSPVLPGPQLRLLLSVARWWSPSASVHHNWLSHFNPPLHTQCHIPHLHAPPRWEATLPAPTQDGCLWGVVCDYLWIPVRHVRLTLLCAHHQTDVSSGLLTPLSDRTLLSRGSGLQKTESCSIYDSVFPPFIDTLSSAYSNGHCWYIGLLLLPGHEHFL